MFFVHARTYSHRDIGDTLQAKIVELMARHLTDKLKVGEFKDRLRTAIMNTPGNLMDWVPEKFKAEELTPQNQLDLIDVAIEIVLWDKMANTREINHTPEGYIEKSSSWGEATA